MCGRDERKGFEREGLTYRSAKKTALTEGCSRTWFEIHGKYARQTFLFTGKKNLWRAVHRACQAEILAGENSRRGLIAREETSGWDRQLSNALFFFFFSLRFDDG